jgi:hypothetical protein
MTQLGWADFLEALFFGLVGVSLGVFTKVHPDSLKDPYAIIYNLGRFAKYGSYITGTVFLLDALRVLIHLL